VKIVESDFVDFNMPVAPSKGRLMRDIDPSTIPYEFSKIYNENAFYPNSVATLGTAYIVRDFRGITISIVPFIYNPLTQTLRVYHHIVLEVNTIGTDHVNVNSNRNYRYNKYFTDVYAKHFINFNHTSRYQLVDEQGRMIVISHNSFMNAIQPYVNWKKQKGFQVDVYDVATIGNANNIKTFIQNQYNQNDNLVFVQLVGDAAQIPSLSSGGGGADPKYGMIVGNDAYVDLFVGRFSAETVAHVNTQVERTVWYERDIAAGATWLAKGIGIGSNQGAGQGDDGQSDIVHLNVIRDFLLSYGYTHVDQIYDPSGTAAQVSNALNDGRGIINYTGHGSDTSWSSTGFSNSHVNSLTNDYKLPFINSVACVNGNFVSLTCFAEAWLRATNNTNGNPTGAIGMFASSVNQSWAPPMAAQDEAIDMICGVNNYAGTPEVMTTMGGLWFNSTFEMLELYNDVLMAETWHIFGDASLQVRTKNPQQMTVSHLPNLLIGSNEFQVSTGVANAMVALSYNGTVYASGYTNATGNITLQMANPPTQPMEITLTVTAFNKVTYTAPIMVIAPDGPYIIVNNVVVNAGGDSVIEFGETVNLTVTLKNVGVATATNVVMQLSETNPYITITDATETFGNLAPDQTVTINNAFTFNVANTIPNEHAFQLLADITAANNSWDSVINLTGYAPILAISNVSILDDANNMLDPGDRAFINVTVTNNGGAKAHNLNALLSTQSNLISFNDNSDTAAMIAAGGMATFMFDIDVSADANIGDTVQFTLNTTADNNYAMSGNFALTIGLIFEDFESGDFTQKPWEFSGNLPWVIATDAYAGSYAAKSGAISHSQTSTIFVELYVTQADEISFWKKVSSEGNYDYLKFYINNQEMGSWSGDVAWAQHTYPVAAGSTIFKWTYSKDGSVSTGSDCAWLDEIIFPPCIVPQPAHLVCNVSEMIMNMMPNTVSTQTFTLQNTGDLDLTYTIGIQNTTEEGRNLTGSSVSCNAEGFYPGETVTWTFTVSCVSNDNEWIKDLWITFPTGVVVNSATSIVGGSGAIPFIGPTGDGVVAHWGGSGYMANGQNATTNVNVTISSGFVGDITLPWSLQGDNWGQPPHEVSGQMSIQSLGQPLTWMTIAQTSGTLTGNQSHQIQVAFNTEGMDFGTYTANIIIQHSAGANMIIPVTLTVGEVSNDHVILPTATVLEGNYPNPFNPSTTLKFATKESGHVAIDIYNVKGQKVRTLVDTQMNAGYHSIVWNGKDDNGVNATSGIYFSRMRSGKYTATRKLILMK
jgi:hypothetical protein